VIRVHADTHLEVGTPKRSVDGVLVTGRLVDDDTLEPLPGRPGIVSATSLGPDHQTVSTQVTTNAAGAFDGSFPLLTGRYQLTFYFPASETHSKAKREVQLDLSRRPVELFIDGPESVREFERARAHVRAESLGQPVDVDLSIGTQHVRTAGGRADIELPTKARGDQRITVYSGETQELDAATAELRYRVMVPIILSLVAERDEVRVGQPIVLRGMLRDTHGPLALGTVDLVVFGERVSAAQADAEGKFGARLDSRRLSLGKSELVAVYHPTATYYAETHSPPVVLTVLAPLKPPYRAYALLLALTACAVLAGAIIRRLRARAAMPAALRDEAPRKRALAVVDPLALDGRVIDARTQEPIAGATIALAGATTRSDEAGRFAIHGRPGTTRLVASAVGYLPTQRPALLPHGGELNKLELRLTSLRQAIVEQLRAATPRLGARFDLLTPRQVGESTPSAQMVELVHLVEQTSYAGRPATEADLDRATQLSLATRH
jgi:hypothetical protein